MNARAQLHAVTAFGAAAVGVTLLCLGPSQADVMGTSDLPAAPARQLVMQNCLICHSAQIISSQRLAPKTWLAEVNKMIKYGAPVQDADKQVIADYLAASFPVDKTPFQPAHVPVP